MPINPRYSLDRVENRGEDNERVRGNNRDGSVTSFVKMVADQNLEFSKIFEKQDIVTVTKEEIQTLLYAAMSDVEEAMY